jgi:hypothetical protein
LFLKNSLIKLKILEIKENTRYRNKKMSILKIIYRRITKRFLLFSGIIILIMVISIIFTSVNIGGNVAIANSLHDALDRSVFVDFSIRNLEVSEDRVNTIITEISKINGIYKVEPVLRIDIYTQIYPNVTLPVGIFAIKDDSLFYKKIRLLPPGQYETILISSSRGDIFHTPQQSTLKLGNITIRIKNVLNVENIGFPLFQYIDAISITNTYIISYDSFLKEFLQEVNKNKLNFRTVYTINVFLDRTLIIDVADLDKSKKTISNISSQIENIVRKYAYSSYSNDNITYALNIVSQSYNAFLLFFVFLSLPLLYIAWYLGSSLSDLMYSLNKREMALFKIRGFSKSKLFILYLFEFIIVIFLGIIVGYFLSSIVLSLSFSASIFDVIKILINNQLAFMLTLIFSFIIAFLIIIFPLRRVLNIPILHALYGEMYEHLEKPYKKLRVWVALILGSYKIIIWIFQINLNQVLGEALRTGNFVLVIALSILLIIDAPLNIIGPFLFLYGTSKILSYHGAFIHAKFISALKFFLKDLALISSKSISRVASRNSVIIFVISLIIFYSFFNVINLSSQEDFNIRSAYLESEADIKVYFNDHILAENSLDKIKAFQEVEYATLVYSFANAYAVNPEEFVKVTFLEESLFKNGTPLELFKKLDENSTILDLSVAKHLNLKYGDQITLPLGYVSKKFKIIGFYGKEFRFQFGNVEQVVGSGTFKSFININAVKEFKTFFEPRILIKLKSLEYTDAVKEKIQEMQGVYLIVTFEEIYKQKRTGFLLTEEFLNFQTIISILLISLGIVSISIVNLFERSKIIVLQHIRGLDRKQLFKINLSSMIGIIISALIIGIITSLATMLGYANMINSTFLASSILEYRIIVLSYHYLYLIATVLAVFLSLIIPIAIFIKRIQAKVEEII